MIKEIGFVTPVFLSGLVGRPITTWQGAAVATDRGMRLIVPLSAIDTCVPWHNVAWWTEPTAPIGVTEQKGPAPVLTDGGPDGPIEMRVTQHVTGGGSLPPGKGKKR